MHTHLHAQNAFTRAKALDDTTTRTPTDNAQLAKQLDRLVGEAGDIGNKSFRRRRLQWNSIGLIRLQLEISALQYYYNGLMCGKDRTLATHRKLAIIQKTPEMPLPLDPPNVSRLIEAKQLIFDQEKSKSIPARQHMLNNRAESLNQQHEKAKASVVKRIQHHETSAAIWRTLAHMSSRGTHQTLDRLDIPASWPEASHDLTTINLQTQLADPNTTTNWRTVTNPRRLPWNHCSLTSIGPLRYLQRMRSFMGRTSHLQNFLPSARACYSNAKQ
jgi:hypothetical protein